ncbi:MAG: protein kinase domain-containing protein, partial [Vicinamibacteria bacterium]
MDTLLSSSRSVRVRELETDPCPSCGQPSDANAAECRRCGRSLIFQSSASSKVRPSSDSFWSPESAPPVEEALDYAPGEIFAGRYVVIDRLGQGGMGVVYKARDREINRTVALKMIRGNLSGDSETLSRFRREPGLAQQVTHENVCRVHDLGIHDGVRYLSMVYLEA